MTWLIFFLAMLGLDNPTPDRAPPSAAECPSADHPRCDARLGISNGF